MADVLYLAPADLGETVLAMGALAHVVAEGDRLTIVCDPTAEALFRAMPGVADVRSPAPGQEFGAWVELAWRHLTQPFDLLLDMRGSPAALAIAAKRKLTRKPPETLRPFIEDASALVGAERTLAPTLWLSDAARAEAAAIAGDASALLVLAPGGAAEAKRWPSERFAAVARRIGTGPLNGARIVVLGAGVRDSDTTRAIVASLDADGLAAVELSANLGIATALAERATLVIGNDNALTHIAAAMGAPTLTLFGPTDERVRAPYGPRTRTLRGRDLAEIAAMPALDAGAAMDDLSIDAVEAAATDLLHAGGLR